MAGVRMGSKCAIWLIIGASKRQKVEQKQSLAPRGEPFWPATQQFSVVWDGGYVRLGALKLKARLFFLGFGLRLRLGRRFGWRAVKLHVHDARRDNRLGLRRRFHHELEEDLAD